MVGSSSRDNRANGITLIVIALACFAGVFLLAFTIYGMVSGVVGLLCLAAGVERLNR